MRFLVLMTVFLAISHSRQAKAARVVYFDVAGSTQTINTDLPDTVIPTVPPAAPVAPSGLSGFGTWCTIMVTNSHPTSAQTVTLTFTNTTSVCTPAVGSMAGDGAIDASAGYSAQATPLALSAGSTLMFKWTFPALVPGTMVTQDVRCAGKIVVDDSSAAAPGYVTASGHLVTAVQSPPVKNYTGTITFRANTNQISTPISIGDGKAF